MRSRNQGGESSSNGHFSSSKPVISHAENEKLQEDAKKKNKPHRKEDEVMVSATVKRHSKSPGPSERKNKKSIELSKEDLIKLLSIMEGELQVNETPSKPCLLCTYLFLGCPKSTGLNKQEHAYLRQRTTRRQQW